MTSELTEGMLERLTLHCNNMQIPLPPLKFEDDSLLWTDELETFIRAEGLCIRWLISGQVETASERKAREIIERLGPDEQARLLACLRDHRANGGSLEDAMRRHGLTD